MKMKTKKKERRCLPLDIKGGIIRLQLKGSREKCSEKKKKLPLSFREKRKENPPPIGG